MTVSTYIRLQDASPSSTRQLLRLIGETRNIDLKAQDHATPHQSMQQSDTPSLPPGTLLQHIQGLSSILSSISHSDEAIALQEIHALGTLSTDFGGLGLTEDGELSADDESELLFLTSAHLESLNSIQRAKAPVPPLMTRPVGRRGMTLSEKIFAAHDVDRRGEVKPGDVIRADVDWILASELSWGAMEKMHTQLGKPSIFRNDRFWLAGDHVVDPRMMDHPKIKPLVQASERAKRNFKMTENQGMNYTIMHTEFCRQRAQPGMLAIGADSHTCSAGSVSALAIGLGAADVILPLVTGETWFKIPETANIRFINKPSPGIGGKDVILYILKELKRNTVAADRVVEYTGPGLKYLSCDARFAIANMTTEFGGVSGIFVPDGTTQAYIEGRKNPKYKSNSVYFQPDFDAQYAVTHVIDLDKVEPFVARYPKPDDVVPVNEMKGIKLQGCFIGACTTAEEDLVLGALVLEQGLRQGLRPVKHGKRKVVPGSMPIMNRLRRYKLTDIYEEAGFEIGVPGCSYCVGMSADKAEKGETWLSSQNRNFENRMGPGSFGSIASAVTVAASSFDMEITSPRSLLALVNMERFHQILEHKIADTELPDPKYVEPGIKLDQESDSSQAAQHVVSSPLHRQRPNAVEEQSELQQAPAYDDKMISEVDASVEPPKTRDTDDTLSSPSILGGKVSLLGDFIDTDALAPNEALTIPNITNEQLGTYCLRHTHPDFRRNVRELGHNIVVAGRAFGCGSSRENAVTALQGAGVQCVIAKSFAFIYGRNQPNLGLLGFEMTDERFWEIVDEGKSIRIDLDRSVVELAVADGQEEKWESFEFTLDPLQRRLFESGGAVKAFGKWGKNLWQALCAKDDSSTNKVGLNSIQMMTLEDDKEKKKLEW